jgi:malate dehydrogenase (quinone)
MNNNYDVAIVGGGISGCALAFILSKYTNIESIAVVEKYERVASLSSSASNNSQTVHRGEIETNYTLEKAAKVKAKADMIVKYCLDRNLQNDTIFEMQKMAIGVGDEEVSFIRKRTEEFKNLYPEMEIFKKDELREIEPGLVFYGDASEAHANDNSLSGWAMKMRGNTTDTRPESIVGAGIRSSYCAINFQKLAENLIKDAINEQNKNVKLHLNSQVKSIKKDGDGYVLETKNGEIRAKFVLVDAGGHSLYLANQMGYGKEYSVFPVAGSFYFAASNPVLNGKVYTVQNPKLPFAAIHGDPDVVTGKTRFGPTALVLPKLERYKSGTYIDFLKSLNFNADVAKVHASFFFDRDIGPYILRNLAYDFPFGLGRHFYDIEVQKIVPSMSEWDLVYADGFGGVRPQIIDKKQRKIILGEVAIKTGEGITFNMTPSPGATSCLGNAIEDAKEIASYLKKELSIAQIKDELGYID